MNINDIIPYEKNQKQHPKKQVEQVAASIKEFGFNQPIVIDKNNIIIVGHGRYEAAKLLDLEDVPVIQVDLTDEQAKAYRLADNKLNESEWDMKLVVEELKGLTLPMLDLTGFSRDLILEDKDKDDDVGGLPSVAKTQPGDIFLLGPHVLMCGDATKKEDTDKLMFGRPADMVFTDPPYNVNYAGRGESTSNTIMNDNMDEVAFGEFLSKVFQQYRDHIKAGAGMYVFHSTSTQAIFERALKEAGFSIKNQLIWNKPTASMGWGDYRWKHEPFFYCGIEGKEIQFYGDRTHSTIWDFQKSEQQLLNWARKMKAKELAGETTIWTMKRDRVDEYVHPTQKPVELICYALMNSSKEGDIVADFFGGSGSTMIACQKLGRIACLMELDPRYCDVIVERWLNFTNSVDREVIKNGEKIVW